MRQHPDRRQRRSVRLARPTIRLRVGLVLIIFVFSVFAGRLVQIQGIEAHAYTELADKYDVATEVTLTAPRGAIVDRDGAPLARSTDAQMLIADPLHTAADAPEIAAVVAEHTDASYLELVHDLRKPDSRFAYLARQVLPEQVDAVMAELSERGLAGVYAQADPLRTYPAGDVAANLVGFLGASPDEQGNLARAGVEFAYNDLLKGTDGHATYVTDGMGTRIPLAESSVDAPEPGTDLALTIDADLQFFAQRRLEQAVKDTGSLSGAAIVMDPQTSEILALADYPSYDPSRVATADAADIGSRAIEQVYEPGSVQKVLTAAALIDAGKLTPRTRMRIPAELELGQDSISDWFDHQQIKLTFAGVIAQSSNIGTAMAAAQLSPEQLHAYLTDFGLGQPTDLGMPGETRGLLPDPSTWEPIRQATIAFGQGLSVNAVQMTTAISAIANEGEYVEPSVVKGTVGPDGEVTPLEEPESRQVVSPAAARSVSRMMEMVTAESGTAPSAAIEGYRVAGKTGTAQRVDPEGGGYATGGFTVSFGGFVPADDPQVVTYVVLQKPSANVGGGSGAGPVFQDITSFALQKYGIPPTGTRRPKLPLTW
ncbi:MAG TPA: penicillin-binding protein 2 [Nocardioidaceae bacterium]|nr:penicillin-binding protein 2 [Nocardioidaceae bacterium]